MGLKHANDYKNTGKPYEGEPADSVLRKLARANHTENWGTGGRQTNNPGTTYAALAAQACSEVDFHNTTGTAIVLRRVGTAVTPITIPSDGHRTVKVIANASEIEVKRSDDSNTQVTLPYIWRSI